jgi:predicted Zn-dependent protease
LLYGVASQYYRQGNWERAREWFYKSLAVWPHHAPYLAEFALYLMRHDELAAADNLASRAVELSPSNRDYRVLLALIRVNRGEFQAAVETIHESLNVLGDDATLYTLLSTAHAALAQHRRAVEAQQAAVRSRKNGPNWSDLLGLAQRFVAAGDTASALSALQDARRASGAQAEVADSLQRLWSRQPVSR